MTPQEIFDKAYIGVCLQGAKSSRADVGVFKPSCMYRGPDGTKCAVGHLIPDDLAAAWDNRKMTSIQTIRSTKRFPLPDWVKENRDFLAEIQNAHDSVPGDNPNLFISEFRWNMELIAQKYGLTVPELPPKA